MIYMYIFIVQIPYDCHYSCSHFTYYKGENKDQI